MAGVMLLWQIAFFISFSFVTAASASSAMVQTSSGTLRGKQIVLLGKQVEIFLGVPYATPPTGHLRFKPPVPATKKDVLDAQTFAPICYQLPHKENVVHPLLKSGQTDMSEDCLYLNLYVPKNSETGDIPVMVWLAGEGFSFADPTQFNGTFLASTQNIIVVTVSYRVSVFGFFNGLSKDAPGNVGLLDQRLALKWIKENIAAFGGNPEKVTLSGRFTGAMSAVIHAASPLSRKETLFQRIILHSGIPYGEWVFNMEPITDALKLAEIAGCVFSNFTETISCLKMLPPHMLLKASSSLLNAWRPSLDFILISETTLTGMLKENNFQVDVLIGTNSNEGSLCLTALKVRNLTIYDAMLDNKLSQIYFEALIAFHMTDIYKGLTKQAKDMVTFAYRVDDESDIKQKFVEFCGDLYIYAISGRFEDILSDNEKQFYVYEFGHRPLFSIQPLFIQAGHGDDVLYSFGLPLQIEDLPEEEIQLTNTILKAIGNFVKNGNPNGDAETHWPSYNKAKFIRQFDNLQETPDIMNSRHKIAAHFWQDTIPSILDNSRPPSSQSMIDTAHEHNEPEKQNLEKLLSMQYILIILLCACGLLLLTLIFVIVVTFKQSSVAFQRLK